MSLFLGRPGVCCTCRGRWKASTHCTSTQLSSEQHSLPPPIQCNDKRLQRPWTWPRPHLTHQIILSRGWRFVCSPRRFENRKRAIGFQPSPLGGIQSTFAIMDSRVFEARHDVGRLVNQKLDCLRAAAAQRRIVAYWLEATGDA